MADDDMAAIVLRRSDVEPSAGLPTEMDGSEEEDDDGRVGGSWSSSSRSDCWKKSSENTWPRLASRFICPLPAIVDMPTSTSPLSHPMKAATCRTYTPLSVVQTHAFDIHQFEIINEENLDASFLEIGRAHV